MRWFVIALFAACLVSPAFSERLIPSPTEIAKAPKGEPRVGTKPTEADGGIPQSKMPSVEKALAKKADDRSSSAAADQDSKSSSDWWLVDLTAVLAIIGSLQLVVFGLQAIRLKQTIVAMRELAKMTISVELPRMALANVELDKLGVSTLLAKLQSPRVTITFRNFGRSPAFILNTCADLFVGTLPPEPPYRNVLTESADKIVEEGHHLTLDKARTETPMLTEDEYTSIFEGRNHLWVFGFVIYRDFLNDLHAAHFCKCLIDPNGKEGDARWYDGPVKVPSAYRKTY